MIPEFSVTECEGVYPPGEDSYLLLDSISVEEGERFLDVGTGTGIIGIHAAMDGAEVTAIDRSEEAVRCAELNARKAGIYMRVLNRDISEMPVGGETFDVMAFNPPYLPESGKEYPMKNALESPMGGGKEAELFVGAAYSMLSGNGRAYLLLSSFTDLSFMKKWQQKLHFEQISRKHIFFEDIFVFMLKVRKDL